MSVRQIGVSVDVGIHSEGPAHHVGAASGLPTFPNPNEVTTVFRPWKDRHTQTGPTSVAVVYTSQLPGLPGADPYCWISRPTGAIEINCWTMTDTAGQRTALPLTIGMKLPHQTAISLNYAVFM